MINLGKKREMFWDDYLVDTERTTAKRCVNQPILKECCFNFDIGMELGQISYPCLVKDNKGYKLYYVLFAEGKVSYAVIESTDGINWIRPNLNIFDRPELEGCNNIVMDKILDNMFVFYDPNPDCPDDEKYKAVGNMHYETAAECGLRCFTSPDGYHFERANLITKMGRFDTLNTASWHDGRYACYFRDFHNTTIPGNEDGTYDHSKMIGLTKEQWHSGIRDVRVIFSEDFKNWTEKTRIKFDDGLDYPLYTNNVIPYERALHISVGFPVRYIERKIWTQNEEQMGASAVKKSAIEKFESRAGLAVTDCIFMCSRDGENFSRYNEAFLTPGYENDCNWVYGDCYLAYGMADSGKENHYMYTIDAHWNIGEGKPLNRYEIRKDGFACFEADGEERVIVTKSLTFEGNDLHLNFETSACGYIYVDVLDEMGNALSDKKSFEIYGNTIDRKICFEDGSDFSEYAGQTIRLRFTMRDAKLYSMWFK